MTLDKAAAVKQVVWDSNQWVSYDDGDTLKMKVDYANGKCLGGVMVSFCPTSRLILAASAIINFSISPWIGAWLWP